MNYTPVSIIKIAKFIMFAPRYSNAGRTWGFSGSTLHIPNKYKFLNSEHDRTITLLFSLMLVMLNKCTYSIPCQFLDNGQLHMQLHIKFNG